LQAPIVKLVGPWSDNFKNQLWHLGEEVQRLWLGITLGMQKTPLKRNLVLFENHEKLTSGPQRPMTLTWKCQWLGRSGMLLCFQWFLQKKNHFNIIYGNNQWSTERPKLMVTTSLKEAKKEKKVYFFIHTKQVGTKNLCVNGLMNGTCEGSELLN
jgi:hypothetical protein